MRDRMISSPGLQQPPNRSRYMKRNRRHVLPEDNFVRRRRIEEVGHCCSRIVNNLSPASRDRRESSRLRLALLNSRQFAHALGDNLRHLGSCRIVEVHTRLTIVRFGQRRELRYESIQDQSVIASICRTTHSPYHPTSHGARLRRAAGPWHAGALVIVSSGHRLSALISPRSLAASNRLGYQRSQLGSNSSTWSRRFMHAM